MSIGSFYAMVGALLRRPADGKYLVLRRSEGKDFASGSWECVTGRVDQGEGFSEAVQLSWEHKDFRWVTVEEASELLPEGYWLLDVIRRAEAIRILSPAGLLALYGEKGFEL